MLDLLGDQPPPRRARTTQPTATASSAILARCARSRGRRARARAQLQQAAGLHSTRCRAAARNQRRAVKRSRIKLSARQARGCSSPHRARIARVAKASTTATRTPGTAGRPQLRQLASEFRREHPRRRQPRPTSSALQHRRRRHRTRVAAQAAHRVHGPRREPQPARRTRATSTGSSARAEFGLGPDI